MLRAEDLHLAFGSEDCDQRGIAPEGALVKHEGFAEIEPIARRSADQRDLAERILHGNGQHFLAVR